MGSGILYRSCSTCGMRLGSSDFVSGRAVRIGHVIRCMGCVRKDFEPPAAPDPVKRLPPATTRRSLIPS